MASAKGARTAAIWGSDQIRQGEARTLGELGQGYDASTGYLNQAKDLYGSMAGQGTGAVARYQDLAGLGAPGSQLEALKASPDFQFADEIGIQGVNRRRAAGGMLNSGNADADAIKFSQGLATQTLGNARNALLPLIGLYSQGTAGQANTLAQLGNNANAYYGNRANVINDNVNNVVGLGVGALKAGDAAKAQNEANTIGLINSGVQLLGSALGGGGGAGNAASGFMKLFG